jgi:hypothetical protein
MSDLDDDPDAQYEILNEINRDEVIASLTQLDRAGRRRRRLAPELILTRATRLLAGLHGLASWLRQSLTSGPARVVSLPPDIGIPTEIRRLFGRCRAASPRNG